MKGGWHFRVVATAIVALTLAGLIAWQHARTSLVRDCFAGGGAWNGPASKCVPIPGAPILQRDLRRTWNGWQSQSVRTAAVASARSSAGNGCGAMPGRKPAFA